MWLMIRHSLVKILQLHVKTWENRGLGFANLYGRLSAHIYGQNLGGKTKMWHTLWDNHWHVFWECSDSDSFFLIHFRIAFWGKKKKKNWPSIKMHLIPACSNVQFTRWMLDIIPLQMSPWSHSSLRWPCSSLQSQTHSPPLQDGSAQGTRESLYPHDGQH